jgi:uncharacterized protein Yka (UPF0111/DUF47 family)
MTKKELKKHISKLRKLKNKMRAKSPERLELHRKIQAMKKELEESKLQDKDKQPIIDEIRKLEPMVDVLHQDLYVFSIEQLNHHLKRLKQRKNA